MPVVEVPPVVEPAAESVAWKADRLMAADSSSGGVEAEPVVVAGAAVPELVPALAEIDTELTSSDRGGTPPLVSAPLIRSSSRDRKSWISKYPR